MHHGLAQPDHAGGAAEHDAGVNPEHPAEKLLPLGFLRHGGELPRLIENLAHNGDDLGQIVPRFEQSHPPGAGMAAHAVAHPLHKEQIRRVDDPEADGGRNHGDAVPQHLFPEGLIELFKIKSCSMF